MPEISVGDVAMGFEKGIIRVFDLSYLFKDSKFMEEKRHSFFVSQFVLSSKGKWNFNMEG